MHICLLVLKHYPFYFWLRWASAAARRLSLVAKQASHRRGFSCGRAQAPGVRASVPVARGFESVCPAAMAQEVSCSLTCGTFLDLGSNQCPLHCKAYSKTTGPPRKHKYAF